MDTKCFCCRRVTCANFPHTLLKPGNSAASLFHEMLVQDSVNALIMVLNSAGHPKFVGIRSFLKIKNPYTSDDHFRTRPPYSNVKVWIVLLKHLSQNIVRLGFHELIFIHDISHASIQVKKLSI